MAQFPDTPTGAEVVTPDRQWTWYVLKWLNDLVSLLRPPVTAPLAITVGASAFVYQNTVIAFRNADVIVQGGTVTKVEISRDGTTYYDTGAIAGMFLLSYNDFLKVTYAVAPTMTLVPR